MKPNVDLTIDRKFRDKPKHVKSNLEKSLLKLYLKERKEQFPWAINLSRITSTLQRTNSLILTGNRDERLNKKRNKEYESGAFCECCGLRFDKKPWKKGLYLLCLDCERALTKKANKSYWLELLEHKSNTY